MSDTEVAPAANSQLAGDEQAAAGQPLLLDVDVDVCVVGAGIAGLTAALELARRGARVVVLEARQIGWGASGHQLGTVVPGYQLGLRALVARVGEDRARQMWAMSRGGATYIRGVIADHIPGGVRLSEGVAETFATDDTAAFDAYSRLLETVGGETLERWSRTRVREELKSQHYFAGIYRPDAFQLDAKAYLHGLADAVRHAGVRIYEDTAVVAIDAEGIRKRLSTRYARIRASHAVLAGGVHLGEPMRDLSATQLPVWRYAGVSDPIPDLDSYIKFRGSVISHEQREHYRVIEHNRLLWSGPRTTFAAKPDRQLRKIRRRAAELFPGLAKLSWSEPQFAAVGHTVQEMPQIGELRPGLWVASGFGNMGMANAAMAGDLIARGIMLRDTRWQHFAEFDLVWAAGQTGRVISQLLYHWDEQRSSLDASLARYRERRSVNAGEGK